MSQKCCLQNGSLDDALHSRRPKQAAAPVRLDWAARITIAAEIASALMHLHSLQPAGVVHGGLQPSCILLDKDLSAQLGDAAVGDVFGLPQVLLSPCLFQQKCISIACKTSLAGWWVYHSYMRLPCEA